MISRILRIYVALLVIGLMPVTGCTSKPVLVSKASAVPSGVDLSGSWHVREDPDADRLTDNPALQDGLILRDNSRQRQSRSRKRGTVQVFLEFGEDLKITQTPFGLFISYDRAVVEEYTFGENRLVAIGPIEAMRVSGWDGNAFTVETLDDSGSVLTETWQIEAGQDLLVRNIQIRKGDRQLFQRRQEFDRL